MPQPAEIVEQFLNARFVAHGRVTIRCAGWTFRGIGAALPVDVIQMLSLGVIGFKVVIAQRPCWRNTAVVDDFSEIPLTEPQQSRAINFGVAADVILDAGMKRLAVLVEPGLIGPVL